MAQPVNTLTLGGTDISADVFSGAWSRGASFDGSSESPGTAVITVANIAGKYNPANGSSPLASVLKIGSELRWTAVSSAVTYGVYHGFLRRVIPLPATVLGYQTAELHCEDALWKLGRAEVNIPLNTTTSVNAFRAAILTAAGEASNRRNLSLSGPEADNPVTYADRVTALNVLTDLNKATGSLHFIDPDPSGAIGYRYTTIDRTAIEASASVETFDDTDLSTAYGTFAGGFDYTDEGVINSQRVVPHGRQRQNLTTVWDLSQYPYAVGAGQTVDVWASLPNPTLSLSLAYTATNSPTVTLTAFGASAKIHILAGSTAVFTRMLLTGYPLTEPAPQTITSADATSQSSYGLMLGPDIDSQYLAGPAYAQGVGDYYVWRYKAPRAKPALTIQNRFPTILSREIGDRITLKSTLLSLNTDYFIRGLSGVVTDGNLWTMTYDLEEAPTALNLFTIGGSAGQGVGGTGVLAY